MTVCMLNATTMLRPLRYGRIHQETVDRGFEDLQSIMYCGSKSKLEYLSLKSSKKSALIDFLLVLPDSATCVCSKESINHGFLEAGESWLYCSLLLDAMKHILIDCCVPCVWQDKDYHRYPVFNKILSNCRQCYSPKMSIILLSSPSNNSWS